MAVIAIDLTSTEVTSAALGKSGKVIHTESNSLKNLQGNEVSLLMQKQIKKILKVFEYKPIKIKSVGIAVPGIYYSKTGTVWAPNIKGWEAYPLRQEMMNFLIMQNIHVKIASKRTCDILGEMWQGAAKGSKNAIFLSVGNGIGAGVLIDGKILHGFNDGVGAVGWLTLKPPFKNEYKDKGSFEYLTSGCGILSQAKELIKNKRNYSGMLKKKDLSSLELNDLFDAYKIKDPIAVKIFRQSIQFWGMAAANIISLYNPEIIIFGGSLFGPALQFLDEIKNEAFKWAQPLSTEKVKFLGSKLGRNSSLMGAGQLAIKKF